MDEEFYKLVKACDAHSNEFIVKLRDEVKVCTIIDTMLGYQEKQGQVSDVCRIYLRKIEHVYYKYDKQAADQAAVCLIWPLPYLHTILLGYHIFYLYFFNGILLIRIISLVLKCI